MCLEIWLDFDGPVLIFLGNWSWLQFIWSNCRSSRHWGITHWRGCCHITLTRGGWEAGKLRCGWCRLCSTWSKSCQIRSGTCIACEVSRWSSSSNASGRSCSCNCISIYSPFRLIKRISGWDSGRSNTRIRLELGRIVIECKILGVWTLIYLPACTKDGGIHIDTPVELLVCEVTRGELKLLVVDQRRTLENKVFLCLRLFAERLCLKKQLSWVDCDKGKHSQHHALLSSYFHLYF